MLLSHVMNNTQIGMELSVYLFNICVEIQCQCEWQADDSKKRVRCLRLKPPSKDNIPVDLKSS